MEPVHALRRAYASLPPAARRLVAIGLGAVALWAALRTQRAWRAWRLRRRFGRARRLERRARRLLARRGYRLLETQPSRRLSVWVDGNPRGYLVRADYVVEDRAGCVFVAEVKSGALATDPLHTPTRRQLLEYQLAYAEAWGVLLIDMERARLLHVRFPTPSSG